MPNLNVLIAGPTGYIGIELVRLLSKHKNVSIKYLCGNTSVGKKIFFYDKSLKSKKLPKIVKFKKKDKKRNPEGRKKTKLEKKNRKRK